MSQHTQYEYDRNYHRSNQQYPGGSHFRGKVYTARDYLLPVSMLIMGIAVLAATILSAYLGVFDRRNLRDSLPGVSPVFSSVSLRTGESSETLKLLTELRVPMNPNIPAE